MNKLLLQTIFLVLAVTLVSCGASTTRQTVKTGPGYGIAERGMLVIGDTLDNDLLATLVVDYVNLYRARFDLPRLTEEVQAMNCARWMAVYQSKRALVTHVAGDVPSMRIFPLRYRACGGESYARGVENAGWYILSDVETGRNPTYDEMARRIVDGWINSPGHRKNLIAREGDATGLVGLGIARGAYSGVDGIYSTMNAFFPWPDQVIDYPRAARRERLGG